MNTLELFTPSTIKRALCIVAHPDDMEYGGSVVVAEWTTSGIEVEYLLLTAGEAGIRHRNPEEVALVRAEEQRIACEIVGVTGLTILNHPDGELTPSLELRKTIARQIRERRPHAVVTMSWDLEASWGLNHSDHRATGISVVDAIRDADNPWVFSDLLDTEGLDAWKVDHLIVLGQTPTHAIQVSERSVELGILSLEAHAEYLAALPAHEAPSEMIAHITRSGGQRSGVQHALPVRIHTL